MPNDKPMYPAVQITRSNPTVAAALSKMETAPGRTVMYRDGDRDLGIGSNTNMYSSILGKRAAKNADTASIFKLLPDLALAKQILVSSILSPKDMTSTELIYIAPNNLFEADLSSSLIARIKEHFTNDYKILPKLPLMLGDALFDKGSYAVAVLPENAIDEFINGESVITTEGIKSKLNLINSRSIGILGNPNGRDVSSKTNVSFSAENYNTRPSETFEDKVIITKEELSTISTESMILENLSITDNFSILKLPKVNRLFDKGNVRDKYSKYSTTSLESFNSDIKDIEIDKLIFRTRQHQTKQIDEIKTQENIARKFVGNPLIMKLPSEAIIPIYVPGDKTDHVGYFVLLDQEGNPVDASDGDVSLNSLNKQNNSSLSSALIKKVEADMCPGGTCYNSYDSVYTAAATRIYTEIIEKDLINRVRNGIYRSNLEIGKNEEIYRIMLARTLAKKYTQLLYIPIEYVTYIAFNYDNYGIGKSLMDDTMTVNTLRAILMFTDLMASVKNSIGRTKVEVDIPPLDVNPEATIERIMDEIVRSRTVSLPTTVSNPSDIIEWIQKAGYEWAFTGHPKIPDLKMSFDQIQSNYQRSDNDLQDNLKKSSISALGLTPEIVDNGLNSAEFATVAIANNVLLNKRVLTFQEQFTPMLSDHLRKIAMNTQSLVEDVKQILESNFDSIKLELDEEMYGNKIDAEVKKRIIITKSLNDFLGGFYVELPKPTSVTLAQQLDDFNAYSDGLDKALDAYISDVFITDTTAGDLATDINVVRGIIKAYFLRKFLSEKGILSELSDLTSLGEDGKPLFDLPKIAASHLNSLNESGVTTLADLAKKIAGLNSELSSARTEEEPTDVTDEGDATETTDDGTESDNNDDTPTDTETDLDGIPEI